MPSPYSLEGCVAVVTGGSGILGSAFSRALASAGAAVGALARTNDAVASTVDATAGESGEAFGLPAEVLERSQADRARETVLERYGRVDILVNAAGGNVPEATLVEGEPFFDLPLEALTPPGDADTASRSIVNVSSLAAQRTLTRVAGYAAVKEAVESFTRWLAVDCARLYGDRLRVNAIAPGFFAADQNRALLHGFGAFSGV